MAKRTIYHVSPQNGVWKVAKEGNKKATKVFKHKDRAVNFSRKLAAKQKLGQVKIHNHWGKLETEYTYHKDPVRYES